MKLPLRQGEPRGPRPPCLAKVGMVADPMALKKQISVVYQWMVYMEST